MVEHHNDDCSCDYVEPYFTNQEQFARVGDVFHIVVHTSEDHHFLPCEDVDETLVIPLHIYSINCVVCLKLEIARLHRRVEDFVELFDQVDDVPY